MRRQFWQRQFQLKANEPGSWVLEARRLKRAADLVFEKVATDLEKMARGSSPTELENLECTKAASLLYGLSLENLLKGLIIRNEGSRISSWTLRRWPGRGHNLVSLSKRAGVALDANSCDLLSRLSAYVEWAGRYPIPTAADRMPLRQRNVSPEWFPLPLQAGERKSLDALYESIEHAAMA